MNRWLVSFVYLMIGLAFFPSPSLSSHEITYFQNNRKGAVSLTFDDGYPSQVNEGLLFLNAHHLKGTFFLITNPGWINSHVPWETWRQVAIQGHEIGNTTVNHFDLTALPEEEMRREIQESQRVINENIPTPFPDPLRVIFAVNCGGPTYVDQNGIQYQADTSFSGGRKKDAKATIDGTEDDPLYQSERYGTFSYKIPVPDGNYTVTLKFTETTYKARGRRIFDVKMEGEEVVTDLDLFAHAGKNTVYDLFIPIHVSDGLLNIDFVKRKGQPKVNAIVVASSRPCLSFAYPFGASNLQVEDVASETYVASRGTWSPERGFLNYYEDGPEWKAIDFLRIGSYGMDADTTLDDLVDYLNLAEQRRAWFCVHFFEMTDTDFFSDFLDHLLTKDVWVDTFGTVAIYMQERLSSTLTVLSETSSGIRLSLFHSLDPAIYDLPLTLRSSVPSSWSKVNVKQGNFSQTVNPVNEDGQTVVYYNAKPNGEEILLSDSSIQD